ncbi:hypothetical protein NDU88_000469 [Pleurodeles waltl]|uniref:Uncharacterized protein n=1 Tax=Pleurodeles waltl TaxID=8319 RepID=A0AAV7Q493_PLEWA|nr:hypothetical protein NDU88_000469 [Pleurodeles waltl]
MAGAQRSSASSDRHTFQMRGSLLDAHSDGDSRASLDWVSLKGRNYRGEGPRPEQGSGGRWHGREVPKHKLGEGGAPKKGGAAHSVAALRCFTARLVLDSVAALRCFTARLVLDSVAALRCFTARLVLDSVAALRCFIARLVLDSVAALRCFTARLVLDSVAAL